MRDEGRKARRPGSDRPDRPMAPKDPHEGGPSARATGLRLVGGCHQPDDRCTWIAEVLLVGNDGEGRIDRRAFVRRAVAAGAAMTLADLMLMPAWHLRATEPIVVSDPLDVYPDRDWERVYRNLWVSCV